MRVGIKERMGLRGASGHGDDAGDEDHDLGDVAHHE
jgi:hypothetical protein